MLSEDSIEDLLGCKVLPVDVMKTMPAYNWHPQDTLSGDDDDKSVGSNYEHYELDNPPSKIRSIPKQPAYRTAMTVVVRRYARMRNGFDLRAQQPHPTIAFDGLNHHSTFRKPRSGLGKNG